VQMLFGDRAKLFGLIFSLAFSSFLLMNQTSIFAGIMSHRSGSWTRKRRGGGATLRTRNCIERKLREVSPIPQVSPALPHRAPGEVLERRPGLRQARAPYRRGRGQPGCRESRSVAEIHPVLRRLDRSPRVPQHDPGNGKSLYASVATTVVT
jgi:hypothetical protein